MAAKNLLKTLREKNLDEAGTEIVSNVAKTVRSELNEEWRTFMKQALGKTEQLQQTTQEMEGELAEDEEISFSKKERKPQIEPGVDYHRDIIHAETRHIQTENRQLKQRLEEIQVELIKIRQTSKELETTFKSVATETLQYPVNVGKYHVNFFEWMLSALQNARVRIESSASWINVIASKKSKKDYWSLAKSHGTSFSLSGERVVAQQTG